MCRTINGSWCNTKVFTIICHVTINNIQLQFSKERLFNLADAMCRSHGKSMCWSCADQNLSPVPSSWKWMDITLGWIRLFFQTPPFPSYTRGKYKYTVCPPPFHIFDVAYFNDGQKNHPHHILWMYIISCFTVYSHMNYCVVMTTMPSNTQNSREINLGVASYAKQLF